MPFALNHFVSGVPHSQTVATVSKHALTCVKLLVSSRSSGRTDSIITGLVCRNHACHRHCMMEWLSNHNDCPVCRDPMWTKEGFVEAKKEVLTEDPEALAKELAQVEEEKRQGLILLDTNQEPDDIVIEALNTTADPVNDVEMVNSATSEDGEEGEGGEESSAEERGEGEVVEQKVVREEAGVEGGDALSDKIVGTGGEETGEEKAGEGEVVEEEVVHEETDVDEGVAKSDKHVATPTTTTTDEAISKLETTEVGDK